MRQLKTFLRKHKSDMLGCGDCECYTLKCWREATCYCNNAFTSFSNVAAVVADGEASIVVTYKGNEYATTITLGNPIIVADVVYSEGDEEDANKVKAMIETLSINEDTTSEEIIALIKKL